MTKHVVIIGAGTAGLALAQFLKKANANVTFRVYDRDRTRSDGLFGYRVGISPEGSRCLAACVPSDLFKIFQETTAITPDYFNMMTQDFQELLSIDGLSKMDADGVGAEYSVSRMTLHQVLLTGVEEHVEFNKAFTHYANNEDGTVTAFFADGSSATGDILVAADGSNSKVRKQYLPQAKLKDTGMHGIGLKVPLNDETRALLPPKVMRGVTMINAPLGDNCIIHVMEFPWDHDGNLKNNIGGNDQELLKLWPGATFDNTRDYILMGFGGHEDNLPKDIKSFDGPALHALMLKRTAKWHPNLRKLFELSDPSTGFAINIRTTERQAPWTSTNIALLGDAIHTMTPGLGVGANTALLDAKILGQNLTRMGEGKVDIVGAVADYEKQMHSYAWTRVEKSLERFNKDDLIYKSGFTGSLALMGMRLGMRVANMLPIAKRKMREGIAKERGEIDERAK